MVARKKTRWFFPVKTPRDALDAIKIAYRATFAVAGIQAIALSLLMWSAGRWNQDIAGPFLMVALGWGLKTRQSRTAAIALLLYAMLLSFATLAALVGAPSPGVGGRNIGLAILFLFASYKGVQGTLGYHRLRRTSTKVRNLAWLCLATFLYAMLYTAALLSLLSVPNVGEKLFQLLESNFGLLWLVPIMVICFLGGFRYLPGTKRLVVVTMDSERPPEPARPWGYISKHWRGELPLSQCYWVNVFLLALIFYLLDTAVKRSGLIQTNPLLAIQLMVGLFVFRIPLHIWQIGGCWRAARFHIERTGQLFWARTVQVVLGLGAVQAIVMWMLAGPAVVDTIQIATLTGPYGDYTISVLEGGEEVKISGTIAFGIDQEFAQTLAEHPSIRLVHLNSAGGRLDSARILRDLVEKHRLATSASEKCYSACLLPFMAGHMRILESGAKLGFHAPTLPGFQREKLQQQIETDKAYFLRRGLPQEFLDKAFHTESSTPWFPTEEELILNGVITHTYDGQQLIRHN